MGAVVEDVGDVVGAAVEQVFADDDDVALKDIGYLLINPYGSLNKDLDQYINTWFANKPRWRILSYAILRILNYTGCRVLDVSYEDIQQNGEEPLRWEDLPDLLEEFDSFREKEKAFMKFKKRYSENKKMALKLIEVLNEFTKAYLKESENREEKVQIRV